MLLAIDPGLHCGWALFEKSTLISCGLVTPAKWEELVSRGMLARSDVLIEEPTLYPHSKARPADVMALQLKVGELKGRFEAVGCKVELVQPRTWKRQVAKHICHLRAAKVLSDAERAVVGAARHDTWDAIAMGLWKLKRTK
jgi:hypothetical protein